MFDAKAYYQENKAKFIAKAKAWKAANREKVLLSGAGYRARNADKIKAYNARTADAVKKRSKKWVAEHKEHVNKRLKAYYEANKECIREKQKQNWIKKREAIRDQQRKYIKNRRVTDPVYKFVCNARRRISNALNGVAVKSARTVDLLGCDGNYARAHIERQFSDGMSWENYGKWHVDHIRPIASFDLSDPSEQRKAFHYLNLQPLWAQDNRRKAAKLDWSRA